MKIAVSIHSIWRQLYTLEGVSGVECTQLGISEVPCFDYIEKPIPELLCQKLKFASFLMEINM